MTMRNGRVLMLRGFNKSRSDVLGIDPSTNAVKILTVPFAVYAIAPSDTRTFLRPLCPPSEN